MDPISIISIITLVVTSFGLLLSLFQSVKENHFESECMGCCKITEDYKGKTTTES